MSIMTGHICIGNRLTIYGRNAMHWGVNFWTKRYGYICFRLPLPCFGKWWPLYLYCSPNATPWAATFMIGGSKRDKDKLLAPMRKSVLGHNFNVHGENNYEVLCKLNGVS